MGNIGGKAARNDVILIGLKGAGKTYLLYNAINEEGWQGIYLKEEENLKRQQEKNYVSKFISLEPTEGFNQEIVQGESIDFNCWDVGGFALYGGELQGEYFASGFEPGIKDFIHNI